MSKMNIKVRALLLTLLMLFSLFTATVSLSGTVGANATAVDLADSEVSPGTELEGSASLSSPEDYLHVVLDENGDGYYNKSTDRITTVDSPSSSTYWSGLNTTSLSGGTYDIYLWDDNSSAVNDGATLSNEATTTVSIDSTSPEAAIQSLNQSTVTGGENITVTYNATDADGTINSGVQSATLTFVNSTDQIVKSVSVTAGADQTKSLSAPDTNGTYDVELTVTDNVGYTSTDRKAVIVDTITPSVGLSSPADGSENTSHPSEIVAKANDNVDIAQVSFRIKHDGEYYNGSSWVASKTWVSAQYNADEGTWEYAPAANGINTNGTYTVIARATDTADNSTLSTNSDTTSSAPLPPSSGDDLDSRVNYTVDLRTPSITDVTVTTADGDGVVAAGDEVTISTNVSDVTSGVETVTVDASSLGESSTLSLAHQSGDHWNTTRTVASAANGGIAVPDGQHTLTVTATDAFGQSSARDSNEFTVDTRADAIEDITIQPGFSNAFIGVVNDTSVRVTATNITDANGNLVTVGTVNISIAGETPFDSVSVSESGDINTTIDPTKLDNVDSLVGQAVSVNIDRTGATTTSVELVHETRTLQNGWHLGGTPLPAQEVLLAGGGMMYRYDTASGNWTEFTDTTYMESPGAGYYFNITSQEARVGYTYEETSSDYTRELEPGYNLVGTIARIDEGETENELAQYLADTSSGSSRITYHVEDTSESDGNAEVLPYTTVNDGSSTLGAYNAYFVEVTESRDDPVVVAVYPDGYDA